MVSTAELDEAVCKVKSLNLATIVREFNGFIVMAQSEEDYLDKVRNIRKGDTEGFYTIKRALEIK